MSRSEAIMDLVAGYDTYAEATELSFTTAPNAEETTPVCAVSAASSQACISAAVSLSVGVTYEISC